MIKKTTLLLLLSGSTYATETSIQSYYIETDLSLYNAHIDSGGFNKAGDLNNRTGDDEQGIAAGVSAGIDFGKLRLGLNYRMYESQTYTTDSVVDTPPYLYKSKISADVLLATAYYDLFQYKHLTFYGGLGLGIAHTDISTTDTVVYGSGSDTNFAWQTELGVEYPISNKLTLTSGLRYFDAGRSRVTLYGGGAEGDFSYALTTKEVFIGLRYNF